MMKKESFAAFLVGTLSVCAVAGVVLSANYCFSTSTLRRLQPQAVASQARLSFAQALLNETFEQAKHNADVDKLLQSLNLKTNVAPVAPASK
jgi:glycerol-3-phosphate cytidylyltransferase-like family protein